MQITPWMKYTFDVISFLLYIIYFFLKIQVAFLPLDTLNSF